MAWSEEARRAAAEARARSDKAAGRGRVPLGADHPYHQKTNAQLDYIRKDAYEAAGAMRGHNDAAENKYRDQMFDATTVLNYRRGGGRDFSPDGEAARKLAQGNPKAQAAPINSGASGRHDYNPVAVNKAIAASNRSGQHIGGREAAMIHALLKGR